MLPNLQIGSWTIGGTPPDWDILPGLGLKRAGESVFPSTIVFAEETLPAGVTVADYIKNQVDRIKVLFNNPRIKGPVPIAMPATRDAHRLGVSYKSDDGRAVIHIQIYASAADLVGIATLTTVEEDLGHVSGVFQEIVSKSKFEAPVAKPEGLQPM